MKSRRDVVLELEIQIWEKVQMNALQLHFRSTTANCLYMSAEPFAYIYHAPPSYLFSLSTLFMWAPLRVP